MGDGTAFAFESSVKPPQLKAARPQQGKGEGNISLVWSPSGVARAGPGQAERLGFLLPTRSNGEKNRDKTKTIKKKKPADSYISKHLYNTNYCQALCWMLGVHKREVTQFCSPQAPSPEEVKDTPRVSMRRTALSAKGSWVARTSFLWPT